MSDVYWYQNPQVLLKPPYRIFPSPDMTLAQRSNALVILVVIITLILWLVGYKQWWLFLLFGLLLVLAIDVLEKSRIPSPVIVEHYQCTKPMKEVCMREEKEERRKPTPRYRGWRR